MEKHTFTPPPIIQWAVAARPLHSGDESGDLYLVKTFPDWLLVAVVDGLGHGHEAAEAAKTAVALLEAHAEEDVVSLVRRCHEGLHGTRGVVMTMGSIRARDGRMTWLGVGDVEGLLLRADAWAVPAREYVLLRGGVVGEALPPLRASVISVGQGDTLILATDGISHGFAEKLNLSAPPQEIADHILTTHGKTTDDNLVLVVRYLGPMQ